MDRNELEDALIEMIENPLIKTLRSQLKESKRRAKEAILEASKQVTGELRLDIEAGVMHEAKRQVRAEMILESKGINFEKVLPLVMEEIGDGSPVDQETIDQALAKLGWNAAPPTEEIARIKRESDLRSIGALGRGVQAAAMGGSGASLSSQIANASSREELHRIVKENNLEANPEDGYTIVQGYEW